MEIDDKLLLLFGTLMLIGGIVGLITNACTSEDKISELEKCMDKYKDYEYCKRYDSENSVQVENSDNLIYQFYPFENEIIFM